MIVLPLDIQTITQCLVIAGIFELFRILIAYALARPSSEANNLEIKILETKIEISRIKSVQLELVKHSKLSRSLIKYEKELETIQAQYAPKALRVKKIFRVIRTVVYILGGIYFWGIPLLLINPQVLWPLSWFTSADTVSLPAWFLLFLFGGAIRHILRTLLPLIFSSVTFP